MSITPLDAIAFVSYFLVVILVAVVVSRREREAADYFLAGRNLHWWLIGISLIAGFGSFNLFKNQDVAWL